MSLGYYYALLREKEYQLERLQACNSQLHAHQQEFIEYEIKITQPTLSSNTWQGMLANKFDQTRTEQMLTKYRELDGQQFSSVYKVLGDKIKSLQEEIISIKEIIRRLEEELAAEREKSK
ncbi:YwqH-like family protein [Rummeliibacillus pycnus]|uniref:YwqH-like family protein n=1 Tax=Rummeliibacillus pycnus TaxID=101070 RepID=UPI003D2B11EA